MHWKLDSRTVTSHLLVSQLQPLSDFFPIVVSLFPLFILFPLLFERKSHISYDFVQYLMLYSLLGLAFQQTGKKGSCSWAPGPWSQVEMIRCWLLCVWLLLNHRPLWAREKFLGLQTRQGLSCRAWRVRTQPWLAHPKPCLALCPVKKQCPHVRMGIQGNRQAWQASR